MLNPTDKANFDTLAEAAVQDELALIECRDRATGEDAPIVATITGGKFTPLARMIQGDPLDQYDPPVTQGR